MTDTVLAEVILRHRLFWPNLPKIMNMQETPVSRFIKGWCHAAQQDDAQNRDLCSSVSLART